MSSSGTRIVAATAPLPVSVPAPHRFRYSVGDRLLCRSKMLLYSAKVIKTKLSKNGEESFRVHYQGWKPRWDEWVDASKLMEENEENLLRAQILEVQMKGTRNKNKNNKNNKNNKKNQKSLHERAEWTKELNAKQEKQFRFKKKGVHHEVLNQEIIVLRTQLGLSLEPIKVRRSKTKNGSTQQLQNDVYTADDINHHLRGTKAKNKNNKHNNKHKRKHGRNTNNNNNNNNKNKNRNNASNNHKHNNGATTSDDEGVNPFFCVINDSQPAEKVFKLEFPNAIKDNLVEQWTLLMQSEMLIKLPKENGFRIVDIFADCKQWYLLKNESTLKLLHNNNNRTNKSVAKATRKSKRNHNSNQGRTTTTAAATMVVNETEFDCVINGMHGFLRNSIANNLMWNDTENEQMIACLQPIRAQQQRISAAIEDTLTVFTFDPSLVYGCEHLLRLLSTMPLIVRQIFDETHGIENMPLKKKKIKIVCTALMDYICKFRNRYLFTYNDQRSIQRWCVHASELRRSQ